ncbi:MAG: hypothetical protein Q7R41_05110, partial [Phycisphaerales bacterium]|nr:hypothetical protein [Phycisphaerales bacterium]
IDMQFEPDLRQTNWKSTIEVPPPINEHDPNRGAELPGILIKITCTTPNEGGLKFINEDFIKKIRENGRKPGAGFYIDNVVLVEGTKAEPAPTGGASRPATGRGPTRGGAGSPTAGSASAGRSEKIDVVTYEPTDNDWRFEIWADAILEEYPEGGVKKEAPPPPKPSKGSPTPPKPSGKPNQP